MYHTLCENATVKKGVSKMFYGTKSLDDIIREVERARGRAERMCEEWEDKYRDALYCYETRRRLNLADKYATNRIGSVVFTHTDVSRRIEAEGIEVYENDDFAPSGRVKCTARAIKRLRTLEKKMDEWNAKRIMCEDALDVLY